MIANGWQLFYFKLFKAALDELEQAVTKLAKQNPAGYKSHPKTRLLAFIYKAITQTVPDQRLKSGLQAKVPPFGTSGL